jgi:hypothetical protein
LLAVLGWEHGVTCFATGSEGICKQGLLLLLHLLWRALHASFLRRLMRRTRQCAAAVDDKQVSSAKVP